MARVDLHASKDNRDSVFDVYQILSDHRMKSVQFYDFIIWIRLLSVRTIYKVVVKYIIMSKVGMGGML